MALPLYVKLDIVVVALLIMVWLLVVYGDWVVVKFEEVVVVVMFG